MSVLCNGFVLRICISQRQTLKVYGRILALTAGFNVFYSAFGAVVGMKELPYDVYFYYFTDSPFLCYAPEMVQHFALTTTFATIFIQAALPSVQFYIRYRVLKDNRPEPAKLYYAFVILVVCFLAYTSLAHLQFEKTTDLHKRTIFEGIRGCNINDRLLPTYSVFDKSSASSQFDDKCAVAIFIACSLVVIYYGALTWLRCKEHLEKTTVMTRKLNRDINLALALQKTLKIYGKLLALTAGFNVFYSANTIFVGMKSMPKGGYFYYFTDSPFVMYAPETVQHLLLSLSFATVYIHAGLPPMQFFFRYRILVDDQPKETELYTGFVLLLVLSTLYTSSSLTQYEKSSAWHTEALFSDVKGCGTSSQLPTYSVLDKLSTTSAILDKISVLILVSSTVIVMYYGLLTWYNFQEPMKKATSTTRKLNKDINLVLALQALLPCAFVVSPTSLFLAGLVPDSIAPYLGLTSSVGMTLSPMLDALIIQSLLLQPTGSPPLTSLAASNHAKIPARMADFGAGNGLPSIFLMPYVGVPCGEGSIRFYYSLFTRVTSLLSITFNAVVLYICLNQQQNLKIYGKLLALTAGFNVFYSAYTILLGRTSIPIGHYFYYFTDSPFLLYAPETVQHVFLTLSFTTVYIHAGLPPMQFVIRYRILRDDQPKATELYIGFLALVVLSLLFTSSTLTQYEKSSPQHAKALFGDVKGCLSSSQLPTYSVFDKSSAASGVIDKMSVFFLVSSTIVVTYYGLLTWNTYKGHMETATFASRKLNRDINFVLALQALLPCAFVVSPTSLFIAGLVPDSISPYLGFTSNVGTTLSPLLDALIVLLIVPAFRRKLFYCFKRDHGTPDKTTVSTAVVTSRA
uniref:G_PROTEIN_RECEP_F1_2 domain-containing protein n=1 Tax=Bursaphelenchus xylophilus TaxID=6326 RepID=A0A1I7RW08_BURXY